MLETTGEGEASAIGGLGLAAFAFAFPRSVFRTALRAATPRTSLRRTRYAVIVSGLVQAVAAMTLFALLFSLLRAESHLLEAVIAAGVAAFSAGLLSGDARAYMAYRAAHAIAAIRGRLPWFLLGFLEDAHRRGVLRQTGATYQFRHAVVERYLAQTTWMRSLAQGADGGDYLAADQLADIHLSRGELDAALDVLQRYSVPSRFRPVLRAKQYAFMRSNSPSYLAWRYAELLFEHSRYDRLMERAQQGDDFAGMHMLDVFSAQGRIDELRGMVPHLGEQALEKLVELYVEAGHPQQAIMIMENLSLRPGHASMDLLDLLERLDRLDDLRIYSRMGDERAASKLARKLVALGRVDDAITETALAVNPLYPGAYWILPTFLADHGRIDDLRQLAAAGHRGAPEALADALIKHGSLDEGIELLRSMLAEQEPGSDSYKTCVERLTAALTAANRIDELIDHLRSAVYGAESLHYPVTIWSRQLRDLLIEQGETTEARRILELLASSGQDSAQRDLAGELEREGNEEALAARESQGETSASAALMRLLVAQGRFPEAFARANTFWKRTGKYGTVWDLAKLLCELGKVDEVVSLLTPYANAGETSCRQILAECLREAGRVDALRMRADTGDYQALVVYVRYLAEVDRADEAVEILLAKAAGHDQDAAFFLPWFLRDIGRVDDAVRVLEGRYAAGDKSASYDLERMRGYRDAT